MTNIRYACIYVLLLKYPAMKICFKCPVFNPAVDENN